MGEVGLQFGERHERAQVGSNAQSDAESLHCDHCDIKRPIARDDQIARGVPGKVQRIVHLEEVLERTAQLADPAPVDQGHS